MKELLLIDLNDLEARLTIKGRGYWEVFFIKLFNGRLEAIARRTVFDRPQGKALSEIIKTVSLENFQQELNDWPPVAIWAVKGLWGVPLEYDGGEKKNGLDTSNRVSDGALRKIPKQRSDSPFASSRSAWAQIARGDAINRGAKSNGA